MTLNMVKYSSIECRYFPKPVQKTPHEIELLYINKGEGICFAGDGLTTFNTGEVFLFSQHISHYLKSAPQFYLPQYPLRCGATYLQFNHDILPAELYSLKECSNMSRLIIAAQRGIKWSTQSLDASIISQIEIMEQLNGFDRMLKLYDILDKLGAALDRALPIASESLAQSNHHNNKGYLMTIDYIIKHFDQPITLDEVAKYVNINKTALCRHFKAHAERSIFDFLLELRINYAKEQLRTTKLAISEIALGAGFNNLPNFNVQFKRLAGCTPGEYRLRKIRIEAGN